MEGGAPPRSRPCACAGGARQARAGDRGRCGWRACALKRIAPITAVVAALAVTLTIYVLRLDRVVGLIVDDAWYVLLAKAMATGQGYTLINSPTPGISPFYPPGFSALLAIFYR